MDRIGMDGRDIGLRPPEMLSRSAAPPALDPPLRGTSASVGAGGSGTSIGTMMGQAELTVAPFNMAAAGLHARAEAFQYNEVSGSQASLQIAGMGGSGGHGNGAAMASPVSSVPFGADAWGSPASVGGGGDGYFVGALAQTAVAVVTPVNIAVAGQGADATAEQSNIVSLHQGALQIAGAGGDGGNGNASVGAAENPIALGVDRGSGVLGGSDVGNGGDGFAMGGVAHASFVLFHPVNIAIAENGSSAKAEQTNVLSVDQHAIQLAGIGGSGGNGNRAFEESGDAAALFQLTGSDAVAFAESNLGNGGDGFFMGSMVDIDVVVYAPVNIAVAGYQSTADAHQSNTVVIDQSTAQLAGLGGDGGDHNAAAGDWVVDLLEAAHLLG